MKKTRNFNAYTIPAPLPSDRYVREDLEDDDRRIFDTLTKLGF